MSDQFELVPETTYKFLITNDLPLLGWKKGEYIKFSGGVLDISLSCDEIVRAGYGVPVEIKEK